jgi:hypothetical protein
MPLVCFICSQSFKDFTCYRRHLHVFHTINHSGVEVKCGQEFCPGIFTTFAALGRHIQQCHSQLMLRDEDEPISEQSGFVTSYPVHETCIAMSSLMDCGMQQPQEITNPVDITGSYMNFLSQLQQKSNMTSANIQLIADYLKVLVTDLADYSCYQVKKLCRSLQLDPGNPHISGCLRDLHQLPTMMEPVATHHKRKKFLTDNGFCIKPLEITLGRRTESRFSSTRGYSSAVVIEDTMQYVPLGLLLAAVISNDKFRSMMSDFVSQCQTSGSHVITHFFHTCTYRSNKFFQSYPDALALHFYVDAFEVTNPLGNHTSVHKLEALYMIVQNFPAEAQSKLSSIFLVALWHAQDVKTYHGHDKILEPVVNDLKVLESDTGMSVTLLKKTITVRAALVLVSADNLGINSLFGFTEGFTARKFCRFCEGSREEAEHKYMENDFILHTRASYDNAVQKIGDATYDQRMTRIKRSCTLNELENFHVIQNYSVDAMHDFLEGVVPLELSLLLVELGNTGYILVEKMNLAISSFN